MDLLPRDLHWVLDRGARTCRAYGQGGTLVFSCEARNRAVNEGSYGHWGNCPVGEYIFGAPIPKNTVPFGAYLILLEDYDGHNAMEQYGRAGIGLHAGGSGLKNPFAPQQGWVLTHGCWRVQSESLTAIVALVKQAQAAGGVCYVSVVSPSPGASADEGEADIVVDEDRLFPDE